VEVEILYLLVGNFRLVLFPPTTTAVKKLLIYHLIMHRS